MLNHQVGENKPDINNISDLANSETQRDEDIDTDFIKSIQQIPTPRSREERVMPKKNTSKKSYHFRS